MRERKSAILCLRVLFERKTLYNYVKTIFADKESIDLNNILFDA